MKNVSLQQHLAASLVESNDAVISKFVSELQSIYGKSIQAIIFYGSCLRSCEYHDAVLDFYVIVDSYKNAYRRIWPALLNKLLPPNVYFLQVDINAECFQAKYSIVSARDLEQHTSDRCFHSYFWARFTQPIALIFTQNENTRDWILDIQQQAIDTFKNTVDCMLMKQETSEDWWVGALQLTYSAELRTETQDRARKIYAENKNYYDQISALLNQNDKQYPREKFCALRWHTRIILGKFLSVLRLLKATATFSNGIDYIAWKINRHTGEKIEINNRLRRFPWLFCWPLLWRLYKRGKIR